MMSKLANTSTPMQKTKQKFKIVYSSDSDISPALKKSKLGLAQGSVRSNDLDAAIKSITYAGMENQTFATIGSATKEIRKVNFNSSIGEQKLEKIVFLPKYVQKKAPVFRDSPKKIGLPGSSRSINNTIKGKGVSRLLSPIKKIANNTDNALTKKRKLGDMALETWNIKTEPLENGVGSVLCRICGSFVEDDVVDLVDVAGLLTTMGSKLKAIVGTDITDSPLYPPACCKPCSVKLNMCFSLLMEMQASDEVVRTTYSEVKEGDLINPNNHIYTCQNCEHEVVGMKKYIHHAEDHLHEKIVGPKISKEEKESEDEDDPTLGAQVFLEEEAVDGVDTDDPSGLCEVAMEMKEEVEEDDGKVECDICEKKMLPTSLGAHKAKHGRRFACHCGRSFAMKHSLVVHMKMHESDESQKESKCHICLAVLPNAADLRAHLQDEHDIHFDGSAGAFQCEHCAKNFDDLFKLKIHLKLYHNVQLPLALKAPRLKRFECHVCKMILPSENSARIHMRKIHNLTNNQMESLKQACEECGKIFSVKQNLINHINSAHLKVKPMSCEYCGERFGKHSSLIFHRLRHTGEKPFKCCLCSKCYRQRNDVMRHLARHVRDNELEYDEAYAINTSSSKFIFKRFVYLKDSTIKGLVELALCANPPKRKKMAKARKSSEAQEFYEEFVISEDAVVMDENGECADVQTYVMAEEDEFVVEEDNKEDVKYILNNEIEENVKYILKNNDGEDEHYVLQKNESGEQVLVPWAPEGE